jgi:hypothetical protein
MNIVPRSVSGLLKYAYIAFLPVVFGFLQNRADVLSTLQTGNCSLSLRVEVIGAEIPHLNGIYRTYGIDSTITGCFSWIDGSKPYYVLNRTSGCSQEGLIDLYYNSLATSWRISFNGQELYEAMNIHGPWIPLNSITAAPPKFVTCYGPCDMPSLTWKVICQTIASKAKNCPRMSE